MKREQPNKTKQNKTRKKNEIKWKRKGKKSGNQSTRNESIWIFHENGILFSFIF